MCDTAELTPVYEAPRCLADAPFTYCPGCTHGIFTRLVAEVIDELGIEDRCVAIASVGCAVWLYNFFDTDAVQAAHGRAPAVATGLKRVRPDSIVWTYQGDGDLAAIGTSEIVHAAARGEKITVIFINNAVYGMTQGQYAPTTLLGQKCTTAPFGRRAEVEGYPLRVSEMLAALDGPAYIARVTAIDPKTITQARRAIKRAFEAQIDGLGFALVECLSTCSTWWGKDLKAAREWIRDTMTKQFPLGVFRDIGEEDPDA